MGYSKKYIQSRADFVSDDGTKWVEVCCYDDRGDPYPPNNFRPELYPSSVDYAGSECMRVDVAWKRARELAKVWDMKITSRGREREKEFKTWARDNYGISW